MLCKNVFTSIIAIVILTACGNTNQTTKTFRVWGNCDMCKETIESSVKTNGVSSADWDVNSNIMTITFDSVKITLDRIQQNIAAVGYDNDKYKGDDNAYKNLPECCWYDRKKE